MVYSNTKIDYASKMQEQLTSMYKQKINRKVIKINNKQSIIIAAKSLRWIESLPENEK